MELQAADNARRAITNELSYRTNKIVELNPSIDNSTRVEWEKEDMENLRSVMAQDPSGTETLRGYICTTETNGVTLLKFDNIVPQNNPYHNDKGMVPIYRKPWDTNASVTNTDLAQILVDCPTWIDTEGYNYPNVKVFAILGNQTMQLYFHDTVNPNGIGAENSYGLVRIGGPVKTEPDPKRKTQPVKRYVPDQTLVQLEPDIRIIPPQPAIVIVPQGKALTHNTEVKKPLPKPQEQQTENEAETQGSLIDRRLRHSMNTMSGTEYGPNVVERANLRNEVGVTIDEWFANAKRIDHERDQLKLDRLRAELEALNKGQAEVIKHPRYGGVLPPSLGEQPYKEQSSTNQTIGSTFRAEAQATTADINFSQMERNRKIILRRLSKTKRPEEIADLTNKLSTIDANIRAAKVEATTTEQSDQTPITQTTPASPPQRSTKSTQRPPAPSPYTQKVVNTTVPTTIPAPRPVPATPILPPRQNWRSRLLNNIGQRVRNLYNKARV